MSEPAIVAERVGKRYSLNRSSMTPYTTLREAISGSVRNGLSRGRLSSPGSNGAGRSEFWALKDVSFAVDRGAILGIIGVNGAGKSTLLKIISRITPPTTGRITLEGTLASLLEVGTGFHRELTGRENIFMNGAILGMRRAEIKAKFDEIVEFAEVADFIDTPVKHYSSGMYVRLAFAVAANLEPDVLIVDEVLAVGDARFQRKCLGKIESVSRDEGRTVLFVSHAMASVRSLCTSAMWLERGSIRQQGEVGEVIHSYLESVLDTEPGAADLDNLPRHWPGHGEQFRIKRLDVNGGEPAIFGKPLTINVDYETRVPLHDVALEIGFGSLDGVRTLTIDSNLLECGTDLERPHRGTVSARIAAVNLQPGRYTLDVAVRSGDFAGLDYLPACAAVTVNADTETPVVIFRETQGVRERSLWEWQREG